MGRMCGGGGGGGGGGVPRIEPRPCGPLSAHISQRGHPTVSICINNLCVCVRAHGVMHIS